MARPVSEFLKGSGKMWEIWKALVNAVLGLGGGDEDLARVHTDPSLARKVAEVIVGAKRSAIDFLDRSVQIVMAPGKSLAQLIAFGGYDWVHPDVVTNFVVELVGELTLREVHLLHYNKSMTSQQVLDDMERQGLRPATFLELLWIGILHPELQRIFPIVALGTVVALGSDRRVAFLGRHDRERYLYLSWFDGYDWNEVDRFAAVRK